MKVYEQDGRVTVDTNDRAEMELFNRFVQREREDAAGIATRHVLGILRKYNKADAVVLIETILTK